MKHGSLVRVLGIGAPFLFAICGFNALAVVQAEASPASISVSMSGSQPGTVVAGDTITYTLNVGNSGTTASGAVTITDELSSNVAYTNGSATCGSVPDCSISAFAIPASCTAGTAESTGECGDTTTAIEWTLASVAPGASGLELSVEVTVIPGFGGSLPDPLSNSATWTGDGCPSGAPCVTNEVNNPIALVQVTGTSDPSSGSTVSPGQTIAYTINLANAGQASSGAVTVEDSLPQASGLDLTSGSATCGSVPACTVSISPTAVCSSGSCPGTLLTWVINSVPAGVQGLNVSFAATVGLGASGSVTNQAFWNGPVAPPLSTPPDLVGQTLLTSGDGCVYGPAPTPSGCLVTTFTYPIHAPIPEVTTPHTGEPWAGSMPYEVALLGLGIGFIGVGEYRRRRLPGERRNRSC